MDSVLLALMEAKKFPNSNIIITELDEITPDPFDDSYEVLEKNKNRGQPFTPLIRAVERKKPDEVNQALDSGAPVNEVNYDSETAFLKAAETGHLGIMERLVDAGADIHYAGKYGNAISYMLNFCYGRSYGFEALTYLLKIGIDPTDNKQVPKQAYF